MDDRKGLDLLDILPSSIIENILGLLPIRDAVRTSVLSTKWRYTWTSLRQLVFSDDSVTFSPDEGILEKRLIKSINHVIRLHQGPIHKFQIRSSVIGMCRHIDGWIFFLSSKHLLELTVNLEKCSSIWVPSDVFSCKNLSHLELSCCEFSFPLTFKGFSYLKTLHLINPLLESEKLENFISKCPLLERLTLSYDFGLVLRICAPNLKYLHLEGEFKEICLQETPQLEVMSIELDLEEIEEHFDLTLDCNFAKFFGAVPNIRRLTGSGCFTKYLSVGIHKWKPHLQWNHLKIIDLCGVDFYDFNEIFVVLYLITNSPKLIELHISGSDCRHPIPVDRGLLETLCLSDCTLKQLKTVSVTELCGAPHEVGFIAFLLENSPVLEEMSISSCSNDSLELNNYLLDKLIGFRRASSLAQILFNQVLM